MNDASPYNIIVGIGTHKHAHAAVAGLGARVAERTIRVGLGGYREFDVWAWSLGAVRAFNIEGTGSYGAARAVPGEQATVLPKAGTGKVTMIRHLTVARDTAVKARTQAMLALRPSSSALRRLCASSSRQSPAVWRWSGIWRPCGRGR